MLHAHEIDDIADRFRHWLRETDEELKNPQVVAIAEQLAHRSSDRSEESMPVGLLQLVESVTAMRHDHKLHAKGLRQLHEDVQSSLTGMNHATQTLDTAQNNAQQLIERESAKAAEPLLTALMDVDDALQHSETTTQNATDSLDAMESIFQELPRWKRWLLGNAWNRLRGRLGPVQNVGHVQGDDTGTLEGLHLLQTRVRRALADAGVTPIACVGRRLDPRMMRVVEAIDDAQLPPETVVDEVRVGYLWQEKTIRIAEVRATKSQGSQPTS